MIYKTSQSGPPTFFQKSSSVAHLVPPSVELSAGPLIRFFPKRPTLGCFIYHPSPRLRFAPPRRCLRHLEDLINFYRWVFHFLEDLLNFYRRVFHFKLERTELVKKFFETNEEQMKNKFLPKPSSTKIKVVGVEPTVSTGTL